MPSAGSSVCLYSDPASLDANKSGDKYPRRARLSVLASLALVGLSGCGSEGGPTPPLTGGVQFTVATTGADLDPNGYSVAVSNQTKQVTATGNVSFADLQPGSHAIEFSGLASNCSIAASTPYNVTVAGGQTQQVSVAITCLPMWTRNNGRVVFASNRPTPENLGRYEIYVMNADGTGQTQLTKNGTYWRPVWSPDGSRIAFAIGVADPSDIYVMNADGTGVTRLTSDPASENFPAWSPDGRQIAFGRVVAGAGMRLFVMNADGTGQTPVSSSIALQSEWSPDGRKIIFASNSSAQGSHIRIVNADGSQERFVVDGHGASWAPDGSRIAVSRGGHIWSMNPDATSQVQLTTLTDAFWPDWSPDGTRIVFQRATTLGGDDIESDIYAINRDGTGQIRLTTTPGGNATPHWGPQRP